MFEEVFRKILSQCIDSGFVAGLTQAIDSAFVKANASMDSLELKVPEQDLDEHLRRVRHISQVDKEVPHRKAQINKASSENERTMRSNFDGIEIVSEPSANPKDGQPKKLSEPTANLSDCRHSLWSDKSK